jgi:hypothetical protein
MPGMKQQQQEEEWQGMNHTEVEIPRREETIQVLYEVQLEEPPPSPPKETVSRDGYFFKGLVVLISTS